MPEMHVESTWQGKRHFKSIGPSGRTVDMDASTASGGDDAGNRPMELVLMGLTGCTGIDIAMILERMREPLESLTIRADGKRREEHPQAFTEIHLTYEITGDVAPAKAWRAIRLSEEKYCSASASLSARIVPALLLNGKAVAPEESVTAD